MRQNFLQFVESRKTTQSAMQFIVEAFRDKDMNKAWDLIEKTIDKHLDGVLIPVDGYVEATINGKGHITKQYMVYDKTSDSTAMFTLNWLAEPKSAEVNSISFFHDADLYWEGEAEADATVKTLGVSIARILPLIWNVMNSKNYDVTSDFVKSSLNLPSSTKLKEAHIEVENYYKFTIFENMAEGIADSLFEVRKDTEAYKTLVRKGEELKAARSAADIEQAEKLYDEYRDIYNAIYRDGAETNEDIQLSIEKKTKVRETTPESPSIKAAQKELDSKRKSPEQVFKEMSKYIELVINGTQPSVIICGAPGVGKTFRVKQQLKKAGYKEGVNMYTYKGKGTTRALYLTLFDYKDKGDIVVIDDADALVGPKAPEDSINILKAALDSTSDEEGRLVNYGISTKLLDDDGNPVQKKFYYNGGIIVITNYRVGQLDSALRGRSFIQDIDFTLEETLEIIRNLMPDIEPDKYSKESKEKAYKFLVELADDKANRMNISVRIFCLCAKLFQSCSADALFTDDDVKSMIREQMKNQSAEGGKKY